MSRTWICLLLVSAFCLANVLTYSSEAHEGESEYWPDDYEEWYKDEEAPEAEQDDVKENTDSRDNFDNRDYDTSNQDQYEDNVDLMIEKEIQETRDSSNINPTIEDDHAILDYQFEDNRSDLEERNTLETGNDDGLPDKVSAENIDSSQLDNADVNSQSGEVYNKELNENFEQNGDVSEFVESTKNDDIMKGEIDGEMLRGNDDDFDGSDNGSMRENDDESQENQETHRDEVIGSLTITDDQQVNEENDKIFKETMSILNESDDEGKFENDDSSVKSETNVDAAFLDETRSLLEQFDDTFDANEGVDHSVQNVAVNEQAEEYDPNNVVPEDTADEAYDDLNEDLDKLFSTIEKLSGDDVENAENENEKMWFSNEFDYDSSHNSFEESERDNDENIDTMFDEMFGTGKEINPDDDIQREDIQADSLSSEHVQNDEGNLEQIEEKSIESTIKEASYDDNPLNYTSDSETNKKIFDDYMKQFKTTHEKELDTEAEGFDRHVASVLITLSVNEPVVVTSPNYPGNYPANNIIDWQFEGEGTGIEFNITDFNINGIIGDYLLVKPGGVDESGNEGLVFTFNLKEPRRYIFSDVDRLFVRFVANPGMSLLGITGFQFSVRQLAHKLGADLPETPAPPEPLLPEVESTHTVHLALSPEDFNLVADQFQQLIADMATFYIHHNNISPGLNTTSETTRILNSTICNVKWPDYESCTRVRFGIPLVYEGDEDYKLDEDQLRDMWETLSIQNPFALRLSNLGIEEFSSPNDVAILTAWVVIAGAVVVAMAVVAIAMCRSSCFVPYTRMPAFSDTDSIHSGKKNLDLYPAPHQDLPPLYSENEYKWVTDDTTRVDMGGYANRSYVRDELYSIDSDEEVVKTRDRYTTDV